MDFYSNSMKELRKQSKKNKNLTEEQWDEYAHENALFSSFTLKCKVDTDDFETVKLESKFHW